MEANFDVRLREGNFGVPIGGDGALSPNLFGAEASRSCGAHYRRSVANP